MDRTLGARLRDKREQRQVSLAAVSAETKIKLCMLEGLENDDVSMWPEGIYRRAYVRAYARVVGLDPEVLVREFVHAHPDPMIAPPAVETELETPAWPAELHRFLNSARSAVPARRADAAPATATAPASAAPAPAAPGPAAPVPAAPVRAAAEAPPNPAQTGEDTELRQPGLVDAAELCTRLSGALHPHAVAAILEDVAATLGAAGLIVWSWNSCKAALTPWIAHGYSETLLATIGSVPADADNGIAIAFRSMESCVIPRGENLTGAVAIPIVSLGDCLGVLALELVDGNEASDSVRAFATILAAQFVPHLSATPLAAAVNA
jgi:hypothetical protein